MDQNFWWHENFTEPTMLFFFIYNVISYSLWILLNGHDNKNVKIWMKHNRSGPLSLWKQWRHVAIMRPQCTWKTFMIHQTFVWWALYYIRICEIPHQTFGPSHRKCLMRPVIFMNTKTLRLSARLLAFYPNCIICDRLNLGLTLISQQICYELNTTICRNMRSNMYSVIDHKHI